MLWIAWAVALAAARKRIDDNRRLGARMPDRGAARGSLAGATPGSTPGRDESPTTRTLAHKSLNERNFTRPPASSER
jgi:hypothetical protein